MTRKKCDPEEIALKSFFLGPQAENAPWISELFARVFGRWTSWRKSLFPADGKAISAEDQSSEAFVARRKAFETTTEELLTRFEKEVPKFSPRYVGHMFSEVSLPALIGHIVTLLHNPNNISGESSRIGTQLEDEAIGFLLSMVGFSAAKGTGHFTSGGTVANLEALVRAYSRTALWLSTRAALKAREAKGEFSPVLSAHQGWDSFDESMREITEAGISPAEIARWNFGTANPRDFFDRIESLSGGRRYLGPVILVPENMHYSWQKGCKLLGLGAGALWRIRLEARGRMSVDHLREEIGRAIAEGRPILLVVSVAGTTELGGIDPVDKVQALLDEWRESKGVHIWHHVDAAYGGFFRALDLESTAVFPREIKDALAAISRADSVTLDPHKLGYVPYASGAFITRNPRDYYFSTFEDAPYIDFNPSQDRGPFTIEGSRSAAGAVATWMTAKTMGFNSEGYGLLLERTIRIAKELSEKLKHSGLSIKIAPGADTNVVCFTCASRGEALSRSNRRTLEVFEAFSPQRNGSFIVSKTTLRWKSYSALLDEWTTKWAAQRDEGEVILIRMTMMNPFFGSVETNVNYLDLYVSDLKRVIAGL